MENNDKKKPAYWVEPIKIAARLSSWIAFPVIIGYFLGAYLDKKYNSSPKWTLIIIGISFFVSMFGLVKNSIDEYKKIEKNEKIDNSKLKKD